MYRALSVLTLFAALATPALAIEQPPAPPVIATVPSPPPAMTQAAWDTEVEQLRETLSREVPRHLARTAEHDLEWIALARAGLADAHAVIDHPQLLVVVDRHPRVQEIMVIAARPEGAWQVIGGAHVSTGSQGRWDHYITPRGVFHVSTDILGYRAEGTKNENGIRGLGAKGSRVWDFGWQVAMKGWHDPPNKGDRTAIRLEMHATDPDVLEQRLGHPASQGCIRIPAAMNRFIDRHGVIDADYERAAATELRFRAVLLRGRTPTPIAGNTLIVVESDPPRPTPTLVAIQRR